MLDSKWYHYVTLTYSNKVINQPFLVHKPFLLLFSVYKFTFFLPSYQFPASLIFITTFSMSIVNTHKIINNTTFSGIISPFNIKFIINHTGSKISNVKMCSSIKNSCCKLFIFEETTLFWH